MSCSACLCLYAAKVDDSDEAGLEKILSATHSLDFDEWVAAHLLADIFLPDGKRSRRWLRLCIHKRLIKRSVVILCKLCVNAAIDLACFTVSILIRLVLTFIAVLIVCNIGFLLHKLNITTNPVVPSSCTPTRLVQHLLGFLDGLNIILCASMNQTCSVRSFVNTWLRIFVDTYLIPFVSMMYGWALDQENPLARHAFDNNPWPSLCNASEIIGPCHAYFT